MSNLWRCELLLFNDRLVRARAHTQACGQAWCNVVINCTIISYSRHSGRILTASVPVGMSSKADACVCLPNLQNIRWLHHLSLIKCSICARALPITTYRTDGSSDSCFLLIICTSQVFNFVAFHCAVRLAAILIFFQLLERTWR